MTRGIQGGNGAPSQSPTLPEPGSCSLVGEMMRMTDLENTGVAGDLTGTDSAHGAATDRARSRSQASGLLIHSLLLLVSKESRRKRATTSQAPPEGGAISPPHCQCPAWGGGGTEGKGRDSGGHQGTRGPLKVKPFPGAAFEREAF